MAWGAGSRLLITALREKFTGRLLMCLARLPEHIGIPFNKEGL
jgi:hypothetical protein